AVDGIEDLLPQSAAARVFDAIDGPNGLQRIVKFLVGHCALLILPHMIVGAETANVKKFCQPIVGKRSTGCLKKKPL
ncbi:hypothetical protein ACC759_39225, partial [Rhizobium ruizarguesonis]